MRRTVTTENRSTDVSPHSAIRSEQKRNAWLAGSQESAVLLPHWPDEKRFRIGSLPGGAMCVCVCRAGGKTASNLKGKQLLFME
jgi:hypothetical protein